MSIDLEQPADIPLAGEGPGLHDRLLVDHEIEADIRDGLQVGCDVDKRVRAGQKRVSSRFQITPAGCTDCGVGARG